MLADSTSNADLDRLMDRIKAEAGRIDVLFANAGGGSMLPLGQITEEHVDDIFGRNVKSLIFSVQKALPLLVRGSSVGCVTIRWRGMLLQSPIIHPRSGGHRRTCAGASGADTNFEKRLCF